MELPKNRFEFEELTKQWNTERKKPSPEFLAINRKNKKLTEEFLCKKDGAEAGKYSPKRHLIDTQVTRNLTIMAPRKVFGRTPTKMPPICEIDKEPCSIEKRMLITQRKKEIVKIQKKQTLKQSQQNQSNQDLADTFDDMYDSDDIDLNEREDMMNSKT